MSNAIRIDKKLLEEAKKVSKAESRTPSLQISYWAKLGKAALDNPELPIEFIRDVMVSRALKEDAESFEFDK